MYSTEFCDVIYLEDLNVAYVNWKKFCHGNDYRNPLLYALEIMKNHDNCNYVADTRSGFENEETDTQWLFDIFLPQTALTTCETIFFIIDNDNKLKEELEGQSVELRKKITVHYCFTLDDVSKILIQYRNLQKPEIMDLFLQEHKYIDFSAPIIQAKLKELFNGITDDLKKAQTAYEFVRDEILHTFDIHSNTITAKASDVLKHKTGICHAKANLLAALLRVQGIPTGFCFQRITLANDDSMGYCIHCYNAIYIDGYWVKVDARGNKSGVNAQFSLEKPILAYPCRPEYDEYFWQGIYAAPHKATMQMLENAKNIQDVLDNIPDMITELPNITEENL